MEILGEIADKLGVLLNLLAGGIIGLLLYIWRKNNKTIADNIAIKVDTLEKLCEQKFRYIEGWIKRIQSDIHKEEQERHLCKAGSDKIFDDAFDQVERLEDDIKLLNKELGEIKEKIGTLIGQLKKD